VDDRRWLAFQQKQEHRWKIQRLLETTRVSASVIPQFDGGSDRPLLAQWLRRPEASLEDLREWLSAQLGESPSREVLVAVQTEVKYEGYIQQQRRQIAHMENSERRVIPSGFSYQRIPGLSREVQEKLNRVQPRTLGQAGRIPGVTPAAIAVLDVYLDVSRFSEVHV